MKTIAITILLLVLSLPSFSQNKKYMLKYQPPTAAEKDFSYCMYYSFKYEPNYYLQYTFERLYEKYTQQEVAIMMETLGSKKSARESVYKAMAKNYTDENQIFSILYSTHMTAVNATNLAYYIYNAYMNPKDLK